MIISKDLGTFIVRTNAQCRWDFCTCTIFLIVLQQVEELSIFEKKNPTRKSSLKLYLGLAPSSNSFYTEKIKIQFVACVDIIILNVRFLFTCVYLLLKIFFSLFDTNNPSLKLFW